MEVPFELRIFLMIIVTLFAMFFAGIGGWLTKIAVVKDDSDKGFFALVFFLMAGGMLLAAAYVAGFPLSSAK